MAGAGIASVSGLTGSEINPAGLADQNTFCLSLSASESYHVYQLINERQEEQLTRIFKWTKYHPALKRVAAAGPLDSKTGWSLGFQNQLTPFLYNQRRAITWSPLFNQTTSGSLIRFFVAGAYRLTPGLSAGISIFQASGILFSEVHGENHGNDTEKWARLENHISGKGFNWGLRYRTDRLALGFFMEPSQTLQVDVEKSISKDALYASLFPSGDEAFWKTPRLLGVGCAFPIRSHLKFNLDLMYSKYAESNIQFNLFEYGDDPVWNDNLALRLGLEWLDAFGTWPLRCGYAFLPQQYAASNKIQEVGQAAVVSPGRQNIQQLFTLGSSAVIGSSTLHLALEYAVLTWHGDLHTYIHVEDSYTERILSVFVEWVYSSSI